MEEDEDRYSHHSHIPIPSYEEATSSRPASSQQQNRHRGPGEISDDAERQNLLARSGYRAPTAESPRSSTDSDMGLPEMTGDGMEARRVIEELDYLDPSDDGSPGNSSHYHRSRGRSNLSKHLANISATFSSIRLPRSLRSLYASVPDNDPSSTDRDSPSSANQQHPPAPRTPWWRRPSPSSFTIPEQYRLSGPTAARLCGILFIALTVWIFFAFDMFPQRGRGFGVGRRMNPEMLRSFAQQHVGAASIANYLEYISSYDHVAGTQGDLFLARWMEQQWAALGGFDEVAMLEYHVYLNYPKPGGRAVKITKPEDKRWKAALEEEQAGGDPKRKQTLVWHGHSKSGEATGPLVYANGGSRDDFAWLQERGIRLNGTIALVRHYATQADSAWKLRAAEDAGCAGVLIFSDPFQDGSSHGEIWPEGRWRSEDSVQRGAVSLTSKVVGDPLTPGWPSTKGAQRVGKERSPALPQIPSLPLAWRDAKVLIDALQGHGEEVPQTWVGQPTTSPWFTGTGAKDSTEDALPEVHLKNLNDENEKQPIWNLHGLIQGAEQAEKKILIGNHRDSWCFGAVDPGSASAVMMEVISIFGALRQIGWQPLRTIEFASWDAKEYNLVGSTEYVEDKLDYLRQHGVGYLNVDVGVFGETFRAAGSPVWHKPLMHALDRVADPHTNRSLKQSWERFNGYMEPLGVGSDYVAFQDIAGTSSIDFGFEGLAYSYPSHSCYETFEWMQKFGDPDFSRHHALAQVWALLILELADAPLVPYDLTAYAKAMKGYVQRLERDVRIDPHATKMPADQQQQRRSQRSHSQNQLRNPEEGELIPPPADAINPLDLKPLYNAIAKLTKQVNHFHKFEEKWTSHVLGAGGFETMDWALQRRDYNERIANFETDLLDIPHPGEHNKQQDDDDDGKDGDKKKQQQHEDYDPIEALREHHGLPGREQFKHVIFGPLLWGDEGDIEKPQPFFPAIRDAAAVQDWDAAQAQVEKVAKIIRRAGERLVDGIEW